MSSYTDPFAACIQVLDRWVLLQMCDTPEDDEDEDEIGRQHDTPFRLEISFRLQNNATCRVAMHFDTIEKQEASFRAILLDASANPKRAGGVVEMIQKADADFGKPGDITPINDPNSQIFEKTILTP